MTQTDLLSLHAGSMRVRLSPSVGGAVVDWFRDGQPVFRPLDEAALEARNARLMGCFPLLPYSNRIAHGRFEWQGQSHQLDYNFPPEPTTIHGVGWQQPWTVEDAAETRARLTLAFNPDDAGLYTWPFRLAAEQTIVLDETGLTLTLLVRNTSSSAWPAGLGLHPHFPRSAETRLGFAAEAVWRTGEDKVPVVSEPVPPEWRFDPASPISGPPLDNCFTGWPGRATIDMPDHGHCVTIEADPVFGCLIVYTPTGKPYCAVEPATHMPDAIHHGGQPGLAVLQPGETLSGTVRFTVTPR